MLKARTHAGRKSPAATAGSGTYAFRLFVAGNESNSTEARQNLAQLCSTYLKGRHRIEIVDVLKNAAAAIKHRVLVTPTLIAIEPQRVVTLLGNLSDTRQVLAALRLNGNRP
ncbi:MAG TPA: circadian clock KaiB family protein [Vicinamibacterales bacterium]|nr:circadian clock KaiB family protein [Vicinamibacterales bacterium]